MATYIILSRFVSEAFRDTKEIRQLARKVSARIKKECPNVKWKDSYATMGRFDVIDIVESDDSRQVEKAALIIRSDGRALTETLKGTPWDDFLEML